MTHSRRRAKAVSPQEAAVGVERSPCCEDAEEVRVWW